MKSTNKTFLFIELYNDSLRTNFRDKCMNIRTLHALLRPMSRKWITSSILLRQVQ